MDTDIHSRIVHSPVTQLVNVDGFLLNEPSFSAGILKHVLLPVVVIPVLILIVWPVLVNSLVLGLCLGLPNPNAYR